MRHRSSIRSPRPFTPVVVPGAGPLPCDYLLLGERPGWEESRARVKQPFVGPSGYELDRLLPLGREAWRLENLIPTFTGSTDDKPTPEEVTEWAPKLEATLRKCKPRLVVTAGAYATRYLLGDWLGDAASMDLCHGLLYSPPARDFDVLPVYHPAAGLRQPDLYSWHIRNDFKAIRAYLDGDGEYHRRSSQLDRDRTSASESYTEVTRHNAASFSRSWLARPLAYVAIDREGEAESPQCFTASLDGKAGYLFRCTDPEAMAVLAYLIAHAETVIFHQALDDMRALARVGIAPTAWEDTMVLAYLAGYPQSLKTLGYRLHGRLMSDYTDLVHPLDERRVREALTLARRKLKFRWAKYDVPKRILTSVKKMLATPGKDRLRTRWRKSTFAGFVPLPPEASWGDLPPNIGVPYACIDAIETRNLFPRLNREVRQDMNLGELYDIDRGIIRFLARITDVGLKVDATILNGLSTTFAEEAAAVRRQIKRTLGYDLNPLSGDQVSDTLADEGVTLTKMTKTRTRYSTGDKYLRAKAGEHAVIPLIMDAREISKMDGTYAKRLPTLLRDGRYHPDFRYTATPTARLAEECILLIPKHSARGKEIRKAFVADAGHILLSTDASQIEMRVMAHESKDAVLLGVYKKGGDVHSNTAYHLLGAPKRKEDQDESKHRLPAKTLNFSVINATTEYGLSETLTALGLPGWDVDASRDFLNGWWKLHTGVADYRRYQVNHAKRHGYITDMYGRRIRLAHIQSTNEQVQAKAMRQCLSGIQSGAQGLMRKWVARIWEEVLVKARRESDRKDFRCPVEPWNFLHDDVILECDTRMEKALRVALPKLMPQDLIVPVTGDSKSGVNWGELK